MPSLMYIAWYKLSVYMCYITVRICACVFNVCKLSPYICRLWARYTYAPSLWGTLYPYIFGTPIMPRIRLRVFGAEISKHAACFDISAPKKYNVLQKIYLLRQFSKIEQLTDWTITNHLQASNNLTNHKGKPSTSFLIFPDTFFITFSFQLFTCLSPQCGSTRVRL